MSRNMKNSLKGARIRRPDSTSKEYTERRMDALERGRLSPDTVKAKLDELLDMTLEEKFKTLKVLTVLIETAKESCKDNDCVLDHVIDTIENEGVDVTLLTVLGYGTLMFTESLADILKGELDEQR